MKPFHGTSRKKERIRLIDDSGFAVRRVKVHSPKPDAWFRSRDHLKHVRTLRCAACGTEQGIEAAHVSKGSDHAKGEKASDYFTVPLCALDHKRQHVQGEVSFWRNAGVSDPILRALEIAMGSTCPKTVSAALEEWRRRYEEVG